jgi:hypothetical protein
VAEPTDGLPEEVRRLLSERLDTIAQLEVLLLLQRTAPREWDAGALSRELRIERRWATEQLVLLHRAGFLEESSAGPGLFRFQPASLELGKAVESLAASYADRRVSVVALLYSKPPAPMRLFADAFRIRKEEDDG